MTTFAPSRERCRPNGPKRYHALGRQSGLLLLWTLALSAGSPLAANPATAAATAAAATANGTATAIFRCGNTYSSVACPDGRAVHIDDSRSDAQRDAATAVATRQAALAAQMSGDRQQQEASLTRSSITPFRRKAPAGSVAARAVASQSTAVSWRSRASVRRYADSDDFVAFAPRPPKPAPAKKTP